MATIDSSTGLLSVGWDTCDETSFFEYHIQYRCEACDASLTWERTGENMVTFDQPVPQWYKKIYIWVTAFDEDNSPIESCEYPRVTIDNPNFQPQQPIEEPTEAPKLLKAEIINGEVCLEWENKEEGVQGTLIKQANCLDCEDVNTTLVTGGEVTSACTNPISEERPLYIWIMNWVESGSFTPISNVITIEAEDGTSQPGEDATSEVSETEEKGIEWYKVVAISVLGILLLAGLIGGGLVIYRRLRERKGKKSSVK